MTALDIFRGNQPVSSQSSWEPLASDFDRIVKNMERILGPARTLSSHDLEFSPACDINETESEYHLSMDIPGLDRDDIKVEVVGHSVKIAGERRHHKEEKTKNEYRTERSYGKFERLFSLPDGVKEDDIDASYDNGVLELTLPKAKKTKSKRIAVKTGKPNLVSKITSKKHK